LRYHPAQVFGCELHDSTLSAFPLFATPKVMPRNYLLIFRSLLDSDMDYVRQLEEQNEQLQERLASLEVECIKQLTSFAFVDKEYEIFSIPPQYTYRVKFNNEIRYCCDKMMHNALLQKECSNIQGSRYASEEEAKLAVETFMSKVVNE
jgi:hypothetical protein